MEIDQLKARVLSWLIDISYKYLKSTLCGDRLTLIQDAVFLHAGKQLTCAKEKCCWNINDVWFISRSLDFQCKIWNKYAYRNQGIKVSVLISPEKRQWFDSIMLSIIPVTDPKSHYFRSLCLVMSCRTLFCPSTQGHEASQREKWPFSWICNWMWRHQRAACKIYHTWTSAKLAHLSGLKTSLSFIHSSSSHLSHGNLILIGQWQHSVIKV